MIVTQDKLVSQRGAKPKYPWALWMNGEIHTITKGSEYVIDTNSMRAGLHTKARNNDSTVVTTTEDDTITFQFTRNVDEAKASE